MDVVCGVKIGQGRIFFGKDVLAPNVNKKLRSHAPRIQAKAKMYECINCLK
jgi:hypothetical protein